jgi:UDP-N-acetylmuramoyl-L-alanyl-D-glutamate--2,6-diaminopimelate ligase
MKLNDLLKAIPILSRTGNDNPSVASIVHDSREVTPGSLFTAISGFKTDGLRFIAEAIGRGAVAVVSEQETSSSISIPFIQVENARRVLAELSWKLAGHPEQDLRIVGVTGTNGKTTITTVLAHVLSECGLPCGICGTLGISFADSEFPSPRTTPEADHLAPRLKQMVDNGAKSCVMEVTSIGIVLHRIYGIPFEIAIFTNLSRDHLDFHATWEAYLNAKLELFRNLPRSGKAIINFDDPVAPEFIMQAAAPVVTYGIDLDADYQAKRITLGRQGLEFDLITKNDSFRISAPLIGKFNVYNLLAVFAAAQQMGIAVPQIISALKNVSGVRGRAEVVGSSAPFTVVVDYAHTPDALLKILETVRELSSGRIITVVGAGGDRDRGKRPEMTKAAERLSDRVFLTSDNPRSEDPKAILQEMAAGIDSPKKFVIEADRQIAIEAALNFAESEDIVVIAGKGHENYQEIKGVQHPFDDRQVALDWLNRKGFAS